MKNVTCGCSMSGDTDCSLVGFALQNFALKISKIMFIKCFGAIQKLRNALGGKGRYGELL